MILSQRHLDMSAEQRSAMTDNAIHGQSKTCDYSALNCVWSFTERHATISLTGCELRGACDWRSVTWIRYESSE